MRVCRATLAKMPAPPPRNDLVSLSPLADFVAAVERKGEAVDALLEARGVDRRRLAEPAAMIRADVFLGCLEALLERSGDEGLALAAGAGFARAHYDALAYYYAAHATVGDAMRAAFEIARSLPLLSRPSLDVRGARAVAWCCNVVDTGRAADAYAEYCVATVVHNLRALSGTTLVPERVELIGAPPARAHARALASFFGVTPRFSSPRAALRFPSTWLSLPNTHADPGLLRVLEREVDALLLRSGTHEPVHERARRAVARRLDARAAVSIDDVAGELGMSKRSLQDALRSEGSAYRDVRDAVRRTRAERLLRDPHTSLQAIATALGFDDVSSLHRCCLRWFGESPGKLLRAARSARKSARSA